MDKIREGTAINTPLGTVYYKGGITSMQIMTSAKMKFKVDVVFAGFSRRMKNGNVIPEGNNDVELQFAQGIKVNGQTEITLTMGW